MWEREHCIGKVAYCAKYTSCLSTDDHERPLKPWLPQLVNSWLASFQGVQILWQNKRKKCEEGHKHVLIMMWHVMEQEKAAEQGWNVEHFNMSLKCSGETRLGYIPLLSTVCESLHSYSWQYSCLLTVKDLQLLGERFHKPEKIRTWLWKCWKSFIGMLHCLLISHVN